MVRPPLPAGAIASSLRAARRRRGISIAALAAQAGVSPRLISEFEHGKRPNVSLETAMRLLSLVGVSIRLGEATDSLELEHSRAQRAARRRSQWSGSLSTLETQVAPTAPSSATGRLAAVARASALATGLQRVARTPRS